MGMLNVGSSLNLKVNLLGVVYSFQRSIQLFQKSENK